MKTRYLLLAGSLLISTLTARAAVQQIPWATTSDGHAVGLYTLENDRLRVRLTNYGARIVSVDAPDHKGDRADVVLGFNNAAQYLADPRAFYGATVGRYANRLAKGTFTVDGATQHVPLNNGGNALHGGPQGFSTKAWEGRIVGRNSVEFTLMSPNGDMGFPGELNVHVRYTLTQGALRIEYTATTTQATVINLTNHTYFNLRGEGSGDILDEQVRINADRYTPVDAGLIPTGEMTPVAGTPFDFRRLTPIGQRIQEENDQLRLGGGYDHNFVLNGSGKMHRAAFALDPMSGRTLTVLTTEPGVQFYSGNGNGNVRGYAGKLYGKHAGFCFETQHFPDSPNHPAFPSTTLLPGQRFHSTTIFVFGNSGS